MLGNVVAAIGVEQDGVVASPRRRQRPFHEHPGIADVDAQTVGSVEAEILARRRNHRGIDFHHIHFDFGQKPGERGGQGAPTQPDDKHPLGRRIQKERAIIMRAYGSTMRRGSSGSTQDWLRMASRNAKRKHRRDGSRVINSVW